MESFDKQAVRTKTLALLNDECRSKKKTADVPIYEELAPQEYLHRLAPSRARMYFQIRAQVYDIKCNRTYMYPDETCRLCNVEMENMDHILNHCNGISRGSAIIDNLYDMSEANVDELISRMELFKRELDRKDDDSVTANHDANLSHTNSQE